VADKKPEPTNGRSLAGFRAWVIAQDEAPDATIHTSQLTRYAMMALDEYESGDKPAALDGPIYVGLLPGRWGEVVGIMTQGTQVLLSQLSMQQGGLPQVAQLSAVANTLIEEIKQQLPQP